ncbi:MAG TPA: hypothetical protein PKA27_13065 [Fimbriimonadaceae bacterium]|nr:hypothetical protein [Fimbriimonadaceae bacterium]
MENANTLRLDKAAPLGGLLAIIGGVIMATTGTLWQSYIYGWLFMAGLTLGALGIVILHNVIRATWSLSILRLAEAAASPLSLFLMFLSWIPIATVGLKEIYLWADPVRSAGDHVLHNKAFFLNPSMFIGCSIAYFAFFIFMSNTLRKSTIRQDQNKDVTESQKRANIASPGLLAFAVVVTFAATHWAMSLEPHWFSTVYPLLSLIGQVNCAVAIATLILCVNANREPYKGIVNAKLTKDLGNILFATTMVWAYLTLSQFLIIWSGNLPEEVPYYRLRAELGWQFLGWILIWGRFFVPFFALLAPKTKRYANTMKWVCIWIILMHILDVFWLVVPGFERGGLFQSIRLGDVGALIGFFGLFLVGFSTEVKKAALVPTHDNRLRENLDHA